LKRFLCSTQFVAKEGFRYQKESFQQTEEEETILNGCPDSNSSYGTLLTKKMGLGWSRNKEVPKTDCGIRHLPYELLECILLKLSYAEIAQVRQVCRRFRDVADGILDREFLCLKTRVDSRLAALLQGDNALPGEPVQSGTRSNPPRRKQSDSRKFLNKLCTALRLLRAVCYRTLFLSEVPQNLRYSSAYFKGEIIDVTHRILKIVRSRWVGRELGQHMHVFNSRKDQWIRLLLYSNEPPLIQYIHEQSKSKFPVLFGSKVIDLLECIWVCEKDITVDIDSGGWCYIKGEYNVYGTFFSKILCGNFGQNPLTLDQQRTLQNLLLILTCYRNKVHFKRLRDYEITYDFRGDLYELNRLLRYKDVCYDCTYRKSSYLIFKVDLKCRKELAPVELLLELPKEQPYEDNEEKFGPGAHTVQDPSPDLELKLQIEKGKPSWKRRGPVYEYLIRQKHTDS
jgi:hypothetical protein